MHMQHVQRTHTYLHASTQRVATPQPDMPSQRFRRALHAFEVEAAAEVCLSALLATKDSWTPLKACDVYRL